MTTPFPFTSGQTLTAAQMNAITTLPISDKTTSYTLVVGDVGYRVIMNNASANTVTVNNNVFGVSDQVQIINKGAGTTTITAGAGVTINSSSGLTLVQYQSGTLIALSASTFLFVKEDVTASSGALVYLTEGTFSGVASVSMAAGTFTTTYKNYRVFLHATSTSTGQNIGVRVNVSGTAQTSSVYYGGWAAIDNSGTYSGFGSNGNSSAVFTNIASGSQAYGEFTIYDPANAATKTWWSGTMAGANSVGNTAGGAGGNLYNVAAAHDGLTFLVNGTFGGTYYVYGITD